ncbi:hypothetical protein [Streptosporangium sp. NPDC002524]|uniref:hypothetical protein n=1 Tax=Streptosporangium sp. NPDC002524 TaxID=3154537 RepID=UPI00331EFD12
MIKVAQTQPGNVDEIAPDGIDLVCDDFLAHADSPARGPVHASHSRRAHHLHHHLSTFTEHF